MLKKNAIYKQMTDVGDKKEDIDILSSNEYLSYFNGIKRIDFYNLSEGDIVGLNELFDYKTELYNFTAECASDEVHLFFLSKKNFSNIMEKENNIMNNVIQLIDLKAKALIGKINNYRYDYRNNVINTLNNKKFKNKSVKNNTLSMLSEIKYEKDEKKNEKKNEKKDEKKEATKEQIMNRRTKSNETFINSRIRDIIISNKRKSFKNETQKSVKLFKNNELLNYLQNRDLVRNNSITDSLNLNNIDKKLLTHRYICKSNYNKIFATNPMAFNFRKKIRLSSNFLICKYNPMLSRNDNDEKNNIQTKDNEINYDNATQNNINNLNNNTAGKIVFNNNSVTPTAETLLIDIMNNQKKFDEFQRAKYYSDNNDKDNQKENENKEINDKLLPIIKNKIKNKNHKDEFYFKKMGKTISFKRFMRKKIKDIDN